MHRNSEIKLVLARMATNSRLTTILNPIKTQNLQEDDLYMVQK